MRVRIAEFCGVLPEVAAGIKAPGSTMRRVTIPENGAVILVNWSNVSARLMFALATTGLVLAVSTLRGTTRSGAVFCASARRLYSTFVNSISSFYLHMLADITCHLI